MNEFSIRYPRSVIGIASQIVVLACSVLMIAHGTIVVWLWYAVGLLCLVFIIASIWLQFTKPRLLRLQADQLWIDGKTVEAGQLVRVYIDFSGTVGLQTKGGRIIPPSRCFRFEQRAEGVAALTDWAKAQGKPVIRRDFIRWL